MWLTEMRDQVAGMQKDVTEALALVKSFERRLIALEQVALGEGKPKKKVMK